MQDIKIFGHTVSHIICQYNTDPHYIIFEFADGFQTIQVPSPWYESVKDEFGLPDAICDGAEHIN